MTASYWAKHFLLTYCVAFAVLLLAGLLRHRSMDQALAHAAIWSGVSAAIYVATKLYKGRNGGECALCGDVPRRSTAEVPGAKSQQPERQDA